MENIVIIGAGQGLGRGIAKKIGNNGFFVTLIARNEENLKKEQALLKKDGVESEYKAVDASNRDELLGALEGIINFIFQPTILED